MSVSVVDLGMLHAPASVDAPVRLHLPPKRSLSAEGTPGVCASWDKPAPVDLTRLSGLDLQDCAWLVRSADAVPLTVSTASIAALISSQIICAGTNATFTNLEELLDANIVVLEGLDLTRVPRVGFILRIGTNVHAHVRDMGWTE